MRGLPPAPPDVCFIETVWEISNTKGVTTGWHVFAPGVDGATDIQLNTLLSDFFLGCVPDLLSLLGTDVSCSVCRLTTSGTLPRVVQFAPSANVGAIGTTNPVNGALVLTWRSGRRGAASLGHTFLPLSDELVDNDHAHLKQLSWSQAQNAASNFMAHLNAITSPDGGQCVLGVLSRSGSGAPLPAAIFSPVLIGDASPFVGTLARRVRSRDPSPSAP